MTRAWIRLLALLALVPPAALAAQLTVFVPGAVRSIVTPMAEEFARANGHTVQWVAGTAGALQKRAAAGEAFDVVMVTSGGIDELAKSGNVAAGSRADLGRVGVGVAVKAGASRPDISTPEAFKAAMLAAKSLLYADPAGGGQSGIHTAKVFAQLGIAEALKPKTVLVPGAPEGLKRVAAGDIEIGLGQVSEIVAAQGVDLVGPFPPALQNSLTFSAGVGATAQSAEAARALIRELTGPAARARFAAAGFETP